MDSIFRFGSWTRNRKQPPDCSQSPRSILAVGNSQPQLNVPTSSNQVPKCFRISGVPSSWNEDDLFDALHAIVPSLMHQKFRPSLYPGCCGSTKIALLNLDSGTKHLERHKYLPVPESTSRPGVLTIDSDFYNLTPLNLPEGEIIADVIAVTGLAGHAFGSWRNRETHQMWLKDFLPYDVKNIRILTYGYDSRLIGHDGVAEMRLLDFQRHFIEQLQNVVPKNRPIILIGHSLGGILILQTLIELKRNPSHKHILDAIYSMLFFGTPHEGMRTYDLEEMVDVESGDYETSMHNLLRQLREGSEFLENQKEELCYIWKEYKPNIVSFYETAPTPTVRRSESGSYWRDGKESEMVKRFSAQLYIPTEERIPVAKNHTNMVKFASAEDETYQTVARYLTEWVKNITESYAAAIKIQNHQKSQEYTDCRKSLKPSDYQSYREEIWLRRHENTCTWILDDQRYRLWAEKDGQAVLWISGDPGCGKSVISSFLTKDITRGITNQVCMAYFFCDDKDERLRSAHAILVNLLAQLLDHAPDINKHFLAEPEYATYKEKTSWSFGMLWRVFERIINDAHRGPVYILIDALDECDEESRMNFLNKLKHLLRDSATTTQLMKIIVTSRPHIPVTLTDVIELPLTAENLKNDIIAFVEASVQEQLQLSGTLGVEVQQALIQGANGMFLWVSLILDDLKKSTNTTPRAIRKALQTLPTDLPGIYINILSKIRKEDQETAQRILQWVVWAMRPLTLQELTIAIAVLPKHTCMSSIQDDMHTDLKRALRLIFGPMLRIEDNDTVHLVHQSAKDFLLTDGEVFSHSVPALVSSSVESNRQLAASCLAYLSLNECENEPAIFEYRWDIFNKKDIEILLHTLPFLDYAATHWPAHARQADRSDGYGDLFIAFQKLTQSRQKPILAYPMYALAQSVILYKVTEPLQIVSSLGLIAFAEELLHHGADINAQGGQHRNALQGAATHGHDDMCEIHPGSVKAVVYFGMLDYTKSLVTKCSKITMNEKYTQLVHAAVESGVPDILKLFLEFGEKHSSPDEHNWTAYMTASQSRNAFALQQFPDFIDPSFGSVFPPAKWVSEHPCVPIQLQEDEAGLLYSGTLETTQCSVKGDHPFPPGNHGTNYFEVTIVESSSSQLYMGVGFCGEHILQNHLPPTYCFSSAYYAGGFCLQGTKLNDNWENCGLEYSSGDVVGCGIDWKSESYFFTLNGEKHKTMKEGELLRRRLYPLVCFSGKCNVKIQGNFQGPFEYALSLEAVAWST
ncbi:hypothetical protein BDD12DRAFT_984533 [Trichophaea hybrida]|nr:hypothetical protein BDD12DRAFT_984533 [Trichophaea hybrida]